VARSEVLRGACRLGKRCTPFGIPQSVPPGCHVSVEEGKSKMDDWPFDQPPNCATLTSRQIVQGSEPILHICHDEEGHGWQFLGSGNARIADAMVVSLLHILELDPSVRDVADLPPGWHAWRRMVSEPWIREPNSNRANG
jgi:hypothetical protein